MPHLFSSSHTIHLLWKQSTFQSNFAVRKRKLSLKAYSKTVKRKRVDKRNRSHSLAKSNCFFLVEYKNKILCNEFAVSSFQVSRKIRNHHYDNNQEINILYALSRNGQVTYTKRILNVDPKSDARLAKSQQHLWIWGKAVRRIIQYTTCNLFWQIFWIFQL